MKKLDELEAMLAKACDMSSCDDYPGERWEIDGKLHASIPALIAIARAAETSRHAMLAMLDAFGDATQCVPDQLRALDRLMAACSNQEAALDRLEES